MATKEIKVKIGADVDGLNKGMSSAEASLARFAKVGAASVVAVGVAMVALTKKSMDNIDVLAKQARSLGLTTAAFQKMALVAGEAGIESGKLSSMLGLMQRNIVELSNGTQAQVDSFNALGVSLSDLKGLSPDEQFAKIAESLAAVGDPAEKTALAMEVFGRAGREAINMLSGYSDAAANAAAFQNRFGIAVTQSSSDNVERANDAVGRLSMVMEGLGNTMAGAVAPAIETVANGLISFVGELIGAKVTLEEFFGTIKNARETLGEDIFNKLFKRPDLIVENKEALILISDAVRGIAADTKFAIPEMRLFASQLDDLGQIGAAEVMRKFADELVSVGDELAAGTIQGDQFKSKVGDIVSRSQDLIAELSRVDGISFGGVQSELSNLAASIQGAINKAVELAKALPGDALPTPTTDRRVGTELPAWSETSNAPSTRPGQQTVDSYGNFIAAQNTGGGGGGGGGGGISSADKVREDMASRLEALMEGMMTEQETVAEWYEQNRTLLEDARAAEMLTEAEFMTQRERLEKEHQERLLGIRNSSNASAVTSVLSTGQNILSAVGAHNKKAMKLAQVFGAGIALINAYQAASLTLADPTLPWFARIAAAGSVLAAGIGFVSAIKSVNSSGGGGGGGGGSSAAAAAPTQQPATTFAFTLQNDPMGFGESFARQLIDQLNSTQRNGGQIRGVMA